MNSPLAALHEELKSWQQGIGALSGFLALMLAALFNYRLNRRRDQALRKEEALSIVVGLYGEIILLRKELARLARSVSYSVAHRRDIDRHFLESHKLPEVVLFNNLSSKIGLLPADLALAITEFHQNLQQAKQWLPLMIEDESRGYSYSCLSVLIPARDGTQKIVTALNQIEKWASIPTVSRALDLGITEDVIESEEILFEERG